MPETVFGIYGFDFFRPFALDGLEIEPLYGAAEATERARNENELELTGFGRVVDPAAQAWEEAERIFVLSAGMTFAQQQHVVTSRPIILSPGDSTSSLFSMDRMGKALPLLDRRVHLGETIQSDKWERASRADFLRTFLRRFRNEIQGDSLRLAFFRQIEICRLSTPFVELHHFLAFSALELLARIEGASAGHNNAAIPITDFLNRLGFNVAQREIETWTRARNAAFHRGRLSTVDPTTGTTIHLGDQLYPLTQVLCDSLLKLLPFDDGHINWNRWRDRMAFR